MARFIEEEVQFFDAQDDDIMLTSDVKGIIDKPEVDSGFPMDLLKDFGYDLWTRSPGSVRDRRSQFIKWMELSLDKKNIENLDSGVGSNEDQVDVDEVNKMKDGVGSVNKSSGFTDDFFSSKSSMSCSSSMESSEFVGLVEESACQDRNLDSGVGTNEDQVGNHREINDRLVVSDESQKTADVSRTYQREIGKESEETGGFNSWKTRAKKAWLRKLNSMKSKMEELQGEFDNKKHEGGVPLSGCRIQRVKVRHCKKQRKELSALYIGQDIKAHEGPIFTMKFSPDGQYLASAGEDGIVRLWQVVEDERHNEIDIPEVDTSCIYFTVNDLSELTPLFTDKDKIRNVKNLKKTSDSACVIFPPKVFRLLEKPLHEFHGHKGEILDLSWSNNNYLLSSSVDKTVRLWQVGHDCCLKVFSHSNYVTCIQFNPVDNNYFISGSIDGKVRIWAIPDCHVVDWTDVKEIVTAVCYRPDGQGGIIGSLTGNCWFYNVSDNNHLQMQSQLCLLGKKKPPGRGITGFQFLPQDFNKVMVTCADSQVRIIEGLNVVGKFKGLNTGSLMSASFTSDGKHILSACEDSNVYMWNVGDDEFHTTKVKKIKSCEHFYSNASVAVPWCGLKSANIENLKQLDALNKRSPQAVCLEPPSSFSLSQDFFLDSIPKGSATYPEEKLPSSPRSKNSAMHKSAYKFLKSSCKSTSNCHAWGLVIVTAGWDGRIKSFHNYGLPVLV
ncbi:WD repeat-containing protein 44-like [Trifolium pratense]|uniref:WD repeat-containing protein 44-like n=1 Tax=Trifolium pratense TaxID=57577 RepID=UPI001E69105A|nr:WD repeat-containing protein 44-like [Trifolium pratense]